MASAYRFGLHADGNGIAAPETAAVDILSDEEYLALAEAWGISGELAAKAAPVSPQRQSGTKLALIASLFRRPEGCTRADILQATGWKAVSVAHAAHLTGVVLVRRKKDGHPTVYWAKKPPVS